MAYATYADGILKFGDHVIDAKQIRYNWDAISFRSEKRAESALMSLESDINQFEIDVDAIKEKGGEIDPEAETADFANYALRVHREYWASCGRCMSSMVVGPANFPVRKNQKALDANLRKLNEVCEIRPKALKRVRRAAWPHGEPGDAIRSNNPDAIKLLEKKVTDLTRRQERMKEVNKAIRSNAKKGHEYQIMALMDLGYPQKDAAMILKPSCFGTQGFESFELTNNRNKIKQAQARLASIKANKAHADKAEDKEHETEEGTVTVSENSDLMRIQVFFESKPSRETCQLLRKRGFRFSRANGDAWQRHLNNAGRNAVAHVLSQIAVSQ